MFEKLKTKWKVNGAQLFLILCTFAIGGSFDGYVSRRLMSLFPLEKGGLWYVIYILMLSVLWPVCVIIVSFPFGQFRFFKRYLIRVARRMKIIK